MKLFMIFLAIGCVIGAIVTVDCDPVSVTDWDKLSYADAVKAMYRDRPHPDEALIHRPPNAPCPSGYTLVPQQFQRYGQTWDGCAKKGAPGEGSLDFLLPSEGTHFSVPVPVDDAKPKDRI